MKLPALALAAVCTLVLAIPLVGGATQATAPDAPLVCGDLGRILATIRSVESGGKYTAQAEGSTASGAYQMIDSAWAYWSAHVGNGGRWPSAHLAPPEAQDAAAAAHVQQILDHYTDVRLVPVVWYYPAAARNPALMDVVPAPDAGNVLTPRQYQTRWFDAYDRTPVDADPTCAAIDAVVAYARAQLGRPYVFGTAGPDTFDCSGLTLAAYRQAGIDLPHSAAIQVTMGTAVPIGGEHVRPGDLVFRRGGDPVKDFGHVGIAISPTEIIHAPRTGDVVRIATIDWSNVQAVRRYVMPPTR